MSSKQDLDQTPDTDPVLTPEQEEEFDRLFEQDGLGLNRIEMLRKAGALPVRQEVPAPDTSPEPADEKPPTEDKPKKGVVSVHSIGSFSFKEKRSADKHTDWNLQ